MTLIDTGPLVALIDKNDADHHACSSIIAQLPPRPFVTTWACFTEAMHLLKRAGGFAFQQALWMMIFDGRLEMVELTYAEILKSAELMETYRDRPMDFADASLVAVAGARGYKQIITLDGDFHIYRLSDGSVLDVVP